MLFLVAVLVKRRSQAPPLPYQWPAAAQAVAMNRFDEYEQVLNGKKAGRLQQQTRKGTFALLQGWQPPPAPPPAPKPKPKPKKVLPPPPTKKPFYSYQPEGATSPAEEAPALLEAHIYQDQQLHDGAGIVVQLATHAPGLPKGTRLFGPVRFAKNRILITLTTAEDEGQRWSVHGTAYDQDFLPGIACPGLAPSMLERPTDRLVNSAITETGTAGILRDVGRSSVEVWKNLRKKKTAALEDGRKIYIKLQPQNSP